MKMHVQVFDDDSAAPSRLLVMELDEFALDISGNLGRTDTLSAKGLVTEIGMGKVS